MRLDIPVYHFPVEVVKFLRIPQPGIFQTVHDIPLTTEFISLRGNSSTLQLHDMKALTLYPQQQSGNYFPQSNNSVAKLANMRIHRIHIS